MFCGLLGPLNNSAWCMHDGVWGCCKGLPLSSGLAFCVPLYYGPRRQGPSSTAFEPLLAEGIQVFWTFPGIAGVDRPSFSLCHLSLEYGVTGCFGGLLGIHGVAQQWRSVNPTGVSKNLASFLGVPVIRSVLYFSPFWGLVFLETLT